MRGKILGVGVAMAIILGVPFLLQPEEDLIGRADDTLVIITPHNEAIRYEFARAFSDFYRSETGRSVRVDWRTPGGTSEISRYLRGEYLAAFSAYWKSLGREWTPEVEASFADPSITLTQKSPGPTATEARQAFLTSHVSSGIDIFFGGGAYTFEQEARAGRLVDCGLLSARPDWFTPDSLPEVVSGEPFLDPDGRWIGAVISSFGICYNPDILTETGVREIDSSWADLTRPELLRKVALADPTKSGSANKAFEMIIQQQIQLARRSGLPENQAVRVGWTNGLRLIQAAAANARYFTDSAAKVPVDVAQGDAAMGMCIDFYGRFQSEAVRLPDGSSRLQYFTPEGGSSIGVDPIGLLRGAPNPQVARLFIRFVLSIEGQKLWNFKVGTPGGPTRYALRRLPVRKELYLPEYRPFRSDPDVFPYVEARDFIYHPEWTGRLFTSLAFILKSAFIDPHDELTAAWKAIIDAGFPTPACEVFHDLDLVSYDKALEFIRPALSSPDPLDEVRLARRLNREFRARYKKAASLARQSGQQTQSAPPAAR